MLSTNPKVFEVTITAVYLADEFASELHIGKRDN